MRYFYIDTENIPVSSWCRTLHKLTTKDVVYVIYTNRSPHLPYEVLFCAQNCAAKVESISVKNGTPNALDFVLVAKLSEQCVTAKKSEHYIISNDKGYSPVINYFFQKGIFVAQRETLNQALDIN